MLRAAKIILYDTSTIIPGWCLERGNWNADRQILKMLS